MYAFASDPCTVSRGDSLGLVRLRLAENGSEAVGLRSANSRRARTMGGPDCADGWKTPLVCGFAEARLAGRVVAGDKA